MNKRTRLNLLNRIMEQLRRSTDYTLFGEAIEHYKGESQDVFDVYWDVESDQIVTSGNHNPNCIRSGRKRWEEGDDRLYLGTMSPCPPSVLWDGFAHWVDEPDEEDLQRLLCKARETTSSLSTLWEWDREPESNASKRKTGDKTLEESCLKAIEYWVEHWDPDHQEYREAEDSYLAVVEMIEKEGRWWTSHGELVMYHEAALIEECLDNGDWAYAERNSIDYLETQAKGLIEKWGWDPWTGMDKEEAEECHGEIGGYLVRSGTGDKWIVVPYCEGGGLDGYRDDDAYGPNLFEVSEADWEAAGWDESNLKGYIGVGGYPYKEKLIEAVMEAQTSWLGASWTHELRTSSGLTDDMCDGWADREACLTCKEASESASRADAHGEDALELLHLDDCPDTVAQTLMQDLSGHRQTAIKESLEQAMSEESEWGDTPAWAPVMDRFQEWINFANPNPTGE